MNEVREVIGGFLIRYGAYHEYLKRKGADQGGGLHKVEHRLAEQTKTNKEQEGGLLDSVLSYVKGAGSMVVSWFGFGSKPVSKA